MKWWARKVIIIKSKTLSLPRKNATLVSTLTLKRTPKNNGGCVVIDWSRVRERERRGGRVKL